MDDWVTAEPASPVTLVKTKPAALVRQQRGSAGAKFAVGGCIAAAIILSILSFPDWRDTGAASSAHGSLASDIRATAAGTPPDSSASHEDLTYSPDLRATAADDGPALPMSHQPTLTRGDDPAATDVRGDSSAPITRASPSTPPDRSVARPTPHGVTPEASSQEARVAESSQLRREAASVRDDDPPSALVPRQQESAFADAANPREKGGRRSTGEQRRTREALDLIRALRRQ
jgi:hypothetical protein